MTGKPTGKQRGAGKPFVKGDPRAGRPKGTVNKVTQEIRDLARALFVPEVWERYRKGLKEGTLGQTIEQTFLHYAYGKPKETHEVTGADGKDLIPAAILRGVATKDLRTIQEILERSINDPES